MWEESRLGGILLGGVPWEESCCEEFHDYHNIDMRENLKFDWIDTVKTTDRDLKKKYCSNKIYYFFYILFLDIL